MAFWTKTNRKSVVILGDVHAPFVDRRALKLAYQYIDATRPQCVVQIGDLVDFTSFSKFRQRILMTPTEEIKKAREVSENIWANIRKASPRSKRFQLWGNHEMRAVHRLLDKFPEGEFFFNVEDLFKFEGVETINDKKDVLKINDVCYTHGWSKPGAHMREFDYQNTVCGHLHRGYVLFKYVAKVRKIVWELGAGYLANPKDPALNYRETNTYLSWTKGLGHVEDHAPKFVPFE